MNDTQAVNDGHEAVVRRLLTPVAKFWICKRGSHFAQEAMECLGEIVWGAQRGVLPADTEAIGTAYLECLRRRAGR